MAKKTLQIIERDGLHYRIHPVAIDGGKTSIGSVEVPCPSSYIEMCEMSEAGLFSESEACQLMTNALAVQMQAARRRAHTQGTMPRADYKRLFNSVDSETNQRLMATADYLGEMDRHVRYLYRVEQGLEATQSVDSIDSIDSIDESDE